MNNNLLFLCAPGQKMYVSQAKEKGPGGNIIEAGRENLNKEIR